MADPVAIFVGQKFGDQVGHSHHSTFLLTNVAGAKKVGAQEILGVFLYRIEILWLENIPISPQ